MRADPSSDVIKAAREWVHAAEDSDGIHEGRTLVDAVERLEAEEKADAEDTIVVSGVIVIGAEIRIQRDVDGEDVYHLDDISAEITGHVMDRLFAAGALDAWLTPAHMKKNRAGVVLTVIATPGDAPALEELMLTETTTFGVRRSQVARRKLAREWVTVKTTFGEVRIKVGRLGRRQVQAAPEYEDCRAIADRRGIPLKTVYQAALDAFGKS